MFPFLRRSSRNKSNRRTPRRFRMESLELRNCPSAIGLGFSAQTEANPKVEVQGYVYGMGQGFQVTLSGPVSATIGVGSSGQFTYLGPATGLGTITGTVTDSAGDTGQASATITHPLPQVNNLGVALVGPGKQVDITGSVSADMLAGLPVTFSGSAGLQTTSTTTDANGHFNLVTTATSLGSVTAVVTDDWGVQSSQVTTQAADSGPQVSSFTVTATGQGKQVHVSGHISGTPPGGATLAFSGSAGVSGSATTDSYGNFNVLTTASQLGSVSAVATDVWGVSSSPDATTLTVQPPHISGLTVTSLGNGEWQIQGTVSGPDVTDDTVQLSGVASASVTPSGSGFFSVIVQIAGNPTGTEYAVATDIWGQTSNQAYYTFPS
ncbi:MAG TPA: hypothetical protein VG125_17415 [Pirellulales bacterium]|jgi:hypothetical protein|nr:hypothetical protein [Pirellulales bacterium]